MKPIEFKGYNCYLAKQQPEYKPLPVFKNDSELGEVVSCWKLSFAERIKVLFTGKLWVSIMTFNKGISPILPTVNKQDIFVK